jgi:hypothetical protein
MPPVTLHPGLTWLSGYVTPLIYGSPILVLLALLTVGRNSTAGRLLAGVVMVVVPLLVVTWLAWYGAPDYAASPIAALTSNAILVVPATVGAAGAYAAGGRRGWRIATRSAATLAAAYLVMAACLVPALIAFVSFGGDTL